MQFVIKATKRVEQGTGASRRLRRAGRLPGIIYGGAQTPEQVEFDHNDLYHMLRNEKFHSSILNIDVEGKKETVVLRDAQWHPFRQLILHLDFQRITAKEKIHMKVPLHFKNGEASPGVKMGHGTVSHVMTDVDVECFPADLPEFIEVDLKDMELGQTIHISQLVLPKDVDLAGHGEGDPVVATITLPRGAVADTTSDTEAQAPDAATPSA